jgi:hypothetical protein
MSTLCLLRQRHAAARRGRRARGRDAVYARGRADDGALLVRAALLDRDGLPLDGATPLGCHAGGCAALPVARAVTADATLAVDFSDLSPAAVFAVTSAVAASVTASPCVPGAAYPAPAALSAFFGGFPAAHAFYGGSVGDTGDVNAPAGLNVTIWSPATAMAMPWWMPSAPRPSAPISAGRR